jgi:hypothetical protein
MVGPTCPKGSTWTKGCFLHGPGHPCPLVQWGQGQNPRVFLWAKAKETKGASFLPGATGLTWRLRLPPWPTPLTYLKGRGGLGRAPSNPSRRPNCCPPLLSLATARRRSPVAKILHHKHHTIVLLIQSISPPYWLNQGGRRCWCAVRVHRSEAPPVVALGSDRITRRRRLVRLHHPCSVEHFRCAISSRVWRSHLSLSLITSPRLDLSFLVCIRRKIFDLLCCETLQWYQS